MHPVLEALIALNDLDVMIQELQSPDYREIGFDVEDQIFKLEKARTEIIKKIPEEVLKKYEKLKKKYKRGIAPVIGGVCMNCFSLLPIAMTSEADRNEKLSTCPNCGIFIYWV